MDQIVEVLVGSGKGAAEIALTLALLFAVLALWRARERTLEQIKKDGPNMAAIIKESSERLERIADALEEQDRTRALMAAALERNTAETQRLRDLIEAEGKLNRLLLERIGVRRSGG